MLARLVWAAVLLASTPVALSGQPDACSVLSADEIRTALGRKDLGGPRPGRASGGYSDCTFAGGRSGDVRIVVGPPTSAADFDLKEQILRDEQRRFAKLPGIGDAAYYYEDRLEFRVGDRTIAVWVNRTPRTEDEATLRKALAALAQRVTARLRRR